MGPEHWIIIPLVESLFREEVLVQFDVLRPLYMRCTVGRNVNYVNMACVYGRYVYLTPVTYVINPLTPNDHYSGRTAPLTYKRCISCIYSTNVDAEYLKHDIYSPCFSPSKCSLFHNSNVFASCIIHILYTGCAKIKKKIIPAPKG